MIYLMGYPMEIPQLVGYLESIMMCNMISII